MMAYKKYFTLTYDDGVEQDKRFIELLKKYGVKGTFCINSGLLGEKDYILRIGNDTYGVKKDISKYPKFLFKSIKHFKIKQEEIKTVYEGFEVASHGVNHLDMSLIHSQKRREEIIDDIKALNDIVGYEIKGHIFPFGIHTLDAKDILKSCGIKYSRTIDTTEEFKLYNDDYILHPTCWHGDRNVVKLLDAFIKAEPEEEDLVFLMWGHSYEFDFGTKRNSWVWIEYLLQKISGNDDIIYCTNSEMIESLRESKIVPCTASEVSLNIPQ